MALKAAKRRLSCVYIGDVKRNVVHNITGVIRLYLLSLANRNYPICVTSWPRQVLLRIDACCCRQQFCLQMSPM
jgi:hypothetical protein